MPEGIEATTTSETGASGAPPPDAKPEGGEGGNGKAGITQEELNAILARHDRRWEKRLEEVSGKLNETSTAQQKLLEENQTYKTLIERLAPQDEEAELDDEEVLSRVEERLRPPPEIKGQEAQALWSRFQKRTIVQGEKLTQLLDLVGKQDKTISELKSEMEKTSREREEAQRQSITTERTARVNEVVAALPHQDDVRPLRMWVSEHTVRDEKTGRWMYRIENEDGDSELIPLTRSSIERHIPTTLLRSTIEKGGSGSQGGSPDRAPSATDVAKIQAKFDAAYEDAKKNPNADSIKRVQILQRELAEAKKKAATA